MTQSITTHLEALTKKAVSVATLLLLGTVAFSQCQRSGSPELTRSSGPSSQGAIIALIRLPQEPVSIQEMTSSDTDLFAAGVVCNNGPRAITALRIGWTTVDKNGNFTKHQGQLTDMAWPTPLSKGAHAYIANQAVPIVADNIANIMFFIAQVDFVGGNSYTADLARLKNVGLADNQLSGQTSSQVPAQ